MSEIKQFLEVPEMRFIVIGENAKIPMEKGWQIEKNYNQSQIQMILKEEPYLNYGVACGFGRIIVVDADFKGKDHAKVLERMKEFSLDNTFMVKTPSGGLHYYFKLKEGEAKPLIMKDENGEVRWQGQQVVAPGSKIGENQYSILKDLPIAETSFETLTTVLAPFLREDFYKPETKAPIIENNSIDLAITDVISLSNLNQHGCEYYGEHPVHGSKNGMNFWVNPSKNTWHCFRCNAGGGALQLFAIINGIIDCFQSKDLKGEKFKQACKLLEEKTGKKILKENKPLEELKKDIMSLLDYAEFTKKFVEKKGLYFDEAQNWWLWSETENRWVLTDETEIMNAVDAIGFQKNTLESKVKGQILEGLKREGRKQRPKPLPKTCIQFKNKIVNYVSGEHFEATKDWFALNPIPHALGLEESTPKLDKLFNEWLGTEKSKDLYEIIAFSLSNDYFIHRIPCFTGSGSNGKGTFLTLLGNFVGKENICSSDLDLLISSRFETARLYKKLVCTMGETNFSTISKTSKLKNLTGQDLVGMEFKNKKPFEDVNYAKIIIATNSLPETEDKTEGFYRRWKIIEFNNKFEEKADTLEPISEIELENLAFKCVKILQELRKNCKFSFDGTIQDRRIEYDKHSNPVNQFIKDNFDIDPLYSLPFFTFYDNYVAYCGIKGIRELTKTALGLKLKDLGYDTERRSVKKLDGNFTVWNYILGFQESLHSLHGLTQIPTLSPHGALRVENREKPVQTDSNDQPRVEIDYIKPQKLWEQDESV